MTTTLGTVCGRCGKTLDPGFRFCPECGLPQSGETVLSTQIQELRRQSEMSEQRRPLPDWQRVLLPAGAAALVVFVLGVGLLLFNRPLVQRLFDEEGEGGSAPLVLPEPRWEPEWVRIPKGVFPSGPPGRETERAIRYDFQMSKYEVTNQLWLEFLQSEEPLLRKQRVWDQAVPGERGGWSTRLDGSPYPPSSELQRPVRNVSALAAAWFGRWLTRRLDQQGYEIRIPTIDEWEYAARGSADRRYPWGDEFAKDPPPHMGSAADARIYRKALGQDKPFLVHTVDDDVTPDHGVMALGTNVQEFTFQPDYPTDELTTDYPAEDLPFRLDRQQARVYRCGAAFGSPPHRAEEELALTWNRIDVEARITYAHVGVRLVKVYRAPWAEREADEGDDR